MNRRHFLAATAGAATIALARPALAVTGTQTIAELAAATPDLSTLLAAVSAAGLAETLAGPGNFTVFAPTNAAFAALPAGTVESLLEPGNIDQLRAILTYHVSAGYYPASQLLGKRGRIPTVQGGMLRIDGRHGVRVNNATVTAPDIFASNGVIHIIDAVLLPH